MFSSTAIATSLIVFSHGNYDGVRIVDATELYEPGRRVNSFATEHFDVIGEACLGDSEETNPQKIYETFKSSGEKELSLNTVNSYLSLLEDAFIVKKALRFDVKGRKYINTPQKYYFSDLGLRNARLNFRQQEESHLMENAIYNELIMRGFNVDVGVVEIREGNKRIQTEVDFVCNLGGDRYYIQSALNLPTPEKTIQESRSLNHIPDNFKKIIVVKDYIKPWKTDDGILILGIIDFLLDKSSLER